MVISSFSVGFTISLLNFECIIMSDGDSIGHIIEDKKNCDKNRLCSFCGRDEET